MSFLAPWTALIAAAAAVPLLVLLYVLKLRRRRLGMASTLLWRRSFEDLQVNVPFQRLRLSALFALQLALLLVLLLALAEPVMEVEGGRAARVILLIDHSASMSAVRPGEDGPRSRLDDAKDAAREIVGGMARGGAAQGMLVIAFGARAELMCGFESRRKVLLEAIDRVQPTDEEANLAAALQLAGTFAGGGEDDGEEPPDVVLISDGGVAPPPDESGFVLRAGQFRFVEIASAAGSTPADRRSANGRNVGIVSLSARRDYEDPSQVDVFARLVNAGPEPVDTLLTLAVDDAPGPMKRVRIAAPEAAGAEDGADAGTGVGEPRAPCGDATVAFSVEIPGGGVIRVRSSVRDDLPSDDTAAIVLPPPGRPRLALVYGDAGPDPSLVKLLEESDPQTLRTMGREAYESLARSEIDTGGRFDLVAFDRVRPERLPGIPSLTIGAAPGDVEASVPPDAGGRRILSWRREHVLMRHVALDSIVYAGAGGLRLPEGSTPLAFGPEGVVIAVVPASGTEHVVVAFEMGRSNWSRHISVAVFLQNVFDHLTSLRSGQASLGFRPGAAITVRAEPEIEALEIRGPEGDTRVAVPSERAGRGGLVTLPALRRVGLYTVAGGQPPYDRIALNTWSEVESDLRPRRRLLVNAEPVTGAGAAEAVPRGLWPWLVAVGLGLLLLEWIVYCLRASGST